MRLPLELLTKMRNLGVHSEIKWRLRSAGPMRVAARNSAKRHVGLWLNSSSRHAWNVDTLSSWRCFLPGCSSSAVPKNTARTSTEPMLTIHVSLRPLWRPP